MQIVVRRAEPRDAAGIKLLVREDTTSNTLKKRYGVLNSIAALIDISPLSLVATDPQDTVIIGFCAFSNGPPPFIDAVIEKKLEIYEAESADKKSKAKFGKIASENWDHWLRERYEIKDISVQNAKFLSYFVAFPDHQIPFIDAALSAMFSLLPSVRYICYLLPDILTPFIPLCSQKFIPQPPTPPEPVPDEDEQTEGESHLAIKKLRKKAKSISKLVNMFKKPAPHWSKCRSLSRRPLGIQKRIRKDPVAEVGGMVAGFMSLTNDVDQDLLAKTFDLDAFDNLIKDVPPEVQATANGDYIKPIPVGPEGILQDPYVLAAATTPCTQTIPSKPPSKQTLRRPRCCKSRCPHCRTASSLDT
ncbi:hypothetical protein BCR33DRAFT_785067 [Rhizoclosmatium globosum]|uniref:Cilia- and flagella-associated protein 61 N-terminal domain-containing protein n=1 Tax=Rhizoclosmatium globosum TaxID=329046 RepID=A0A1Y2CBG8_9FUNG|nr:hypothetical protein BCR33DRAFT_785067 [Rhizoclosmatium globosum]|eukprot:ORY44379.1 hypothetical protein BCR33DRAFT_785067 [Rhizoclosmatium globosum]